MPSWMRPGLPGLSHLSGLMQHFRSDIWNACCSRFLLNIAGSQQHFNSSHVREGDKALLRSILVGGVWSGFFG